jgi:phage terminase large subunit-like protein
MTAPLELLAGLRDSVGLWGDGATPAQWQDAEAVLSLEGPRRFWLGRSKGYSKTRDLGAMSIVALLTQFPVGATGYAAASDADQASLLRQSIGNFAANTPALDGLLTVDQRKVSSKTGEIIILAADTAGSHGLRGYWLCVDELANWNDTAKNREFFDSLWAMLPKTKGSRGIVITTAGSPSHFARHILEVAKTEPSWYVNDLHGPPPWSDPQEIASEQRRLFPSTFDRLWMNVWAESEDSIAEPADVAAACVLDGPLEPEQGSHYICTLDLGVKNDRTCAVIAHPTRTDDGTKVTVDQLAVWTPRPLRPVKLEDVKAWLVEMCRLYRAKLIFDPSQGYLLAEQLRKVGVQCEEFIFTSSSVGRLASSLMQSLRSRLVELPNDEELRKELLSVRLRESSPNVYRVDTVGSGHDDRVIAVAMAVHSLTTSTGGQAREYFESLAPIHVCGQPNAAGSTVCSKCHEPIAPAVEEAKPQQPWSPYGQQQTDIQPDRNTLATLELLRQYNESQQRGTPFNPYAQPWLR